MRRGLLNQRESEVDDRILRIRVEGLCELQEHDPRRLRGNASVQRASGEENTEYCIPDPQRLVRAK